MEKINNETGFTLIELMIGMLIASLLIGPYVYQKQVEFKESLDAITLSEIQDIGTSAQNYAAEQNLSWPDEENQCSSAISLMRNEGYLSGLSDNSVFDTAYKTSCTPSPGSRFSVEVDTKTSAQAEILASYLASSVVTGQTVRYSIPLPSSIPALEHLLPRDGSRPMTGDLDLDENNIENVNQISTETDLLNSVVTKGSPCSKNGLIARDNGGLVLSCNQGIWTGASGSPEGMLAHFYLDSCPDGWKVADGSQGTIDARGKFLRSLDIGGGLDPGRTLGSTQGDAIRNITGGGIASGGYGNASGAFYRSSGFNPQDFNGSERHYTAKFDASRVVPTANENRPVNIALLTCQKFD